MELGGALGGPETLEEDPLCWRLDPPWELEDWLPPEVSLSPLSAGCGLTDLPLEDDLSSSRVGDGRLKRFCKSTASLQTVGILIPCLRWTSVDWNLTSLPLGGIWLAEGAAGGGGAG